MNELIEYDHHDEVEEVEFKIHFYGHYNEPYYLLKIPRSHLKDLKRDQHLIQQITFDFDKMDWDDRNH